MVVDIDINVDRLVLFEVEVGFYFYRGRSDCSDRVGVFEEEVLGCKILVVEIFDLGVFN